MGLKEEIGSTAKTCLLLHSLTTAYSTPEPLIERFENLPGSDSMISAGLGIFSWAVTEGSLFLGTAVYAIAERRLEYALPAIAKLATNTASLAYSKTEHYKQKRKAYCEKHGLSLDWMAEKDS